MKIFDQIEKKLIEKKLDFAENTLPEVNKTLVLMEKAYDIFGNDLSKVDDCTEIYRGIQKLNIIKDYLLELRKLSRNMLDNTYDVPLSEYRSFVKCISDFEAIMSIYNTKE